MPRVFAFGTQVWYCGTCSHSSSSVRPSMSQCGQANSPSVPRAAMCRSWPVSADRSADTMFASSLPPTAMHACRVRGLFTAVRLHTTRKTARPPGSVRKRAPSSIPLSLPSRAVPNFTTTTRGNAPASAAPTRNSVASSTVVNVRTVNPHDAGDTKANSDAVGPRKRSSCAAPPAAMVAADCPVVRWDRLSTPKTATRVHNDGGLPP
mmetsp:Transcript_19918/g.70464  ORF Transcript_19918/g.70464 Transcript_19918/m.70464 type:complete len:207 (+) Transcript_19918:508-1128(+)